MIFRIKSISYCTDERLWEINITILQWMNDWIVKNSWLNQRWKVLIYFMLCLEKLYKEKYFSVILIKLIFIVTNDCIPYEESISYSKS